MHLFFVWFMFEFGQGISILVKLDGVVRDKSNKTSSRVAILLDRWPIFLYRAFFVSCGFGIFFTGAAPSILKIIGMGEDTKTVMIATELASLMNTLVAPFLAGSFGCLADFLISKIPGLASYVPVVDAAPTKSDS